MTWITHSFRFAPPSPDGLLFLFCSLFVALSWHSHDTRENTVNYDCTRTNQQNTIITRHLARHSLLITRDTQFYYIATETSKTTKTTIRLAFENHTVNLCSVTVAILLLFLTNIYILGQFYYFA